MTKISQYIVEDKWYEKMQPQRYTAWLPFRKSIISTIIYTTHKGLSHDLLQWGIFIALALHTDKNYLLLLQSKTTLLKKSNLDIACSKRPQKHSNQDNFIFKFIIALLLILCFKIIILIWTTYLFKAILRKSWLSGSILIFSQYVWLTLFFILVQSAQWVSLQHSVAA